MFSALSSLVGQISALLPPGLIQTIVISFMPINASNPYVAELIGSMLMIALTFSPGKWIFADAVYPSWAVHALGVVAADKIGGGQHVNPSMSVTMYALGKCYVLQDLWQEDSSPSLYANTCLMQWDG